MQRTRTIIREATGIDLPIGGGDARSLRTALKIRPCPDPASVEMAFIDYICSQRGASFCFVERLPYRTKKGIYDRVEVGVCEEHDSDVLCLMHSEYFFFDLTPPKKKRHRKTARKA